MSMEFHKNTYTENINIGVISLQIDLNPWDWMRSPRKVALNFGYLIRIFWRTFKYRWMDPIRLKVFCCCCYNKLVEVQEVYVAQFLNYFKDYVLDTDI